MNIGCTPKTRKREREREVIVNIFNWTLVLQNIIAALWSWSSKLNHSNHSSNQLQRAGSQPSKNQVFSSILSIEYWLTSRELLHQWGWSSNWVENPPAKCVLTGVDATKNIGASSCASVGVPQGHQAFLDWLEKVIPSNSANTVRIQYCTIVPNWMGVGEEPHEIVSYLKKLVKD